jgi:uncharacterized membrane protein
MIGCYCGIFSNSEARNSFYHRGHRGLREQQQEETVNVYSFTRVLTFFTAILRVQGFFQSFFAVSLFDSLSSLFFVVSSPFEFFCSSSGSVSSVTSVVDAVSSPFLRN